jgi:3-oxoacyl-(acyl-carrier-protein) synthase
MDNNIYLLSASQISVQSPLCEDWFDSPVFYNEQYARAIDPDFKQFFAPNVSRRMGKILKRALLTSREAMKAAGVEKPDAIVVGTGLGCVENTEIFLDKLVREGEELLNPTYFMQSTHNTISSLVAIDSACHGYNSTYAHKGISFECALQDVFIQLKNKQIQTALAGAHDEMTPAYFTLLKKSGFLGQPGQTFAGETAVSMLLSCEKTETALCRLSGIEKYYRPEKAELQQYSGRFLQQAACPLSEIDAVMIGTNGQKAHDEPYLELCAELFPAKKLLHYKHLFGESYTASAFGVYVSALCLARRQIPGHLFVNQKEKNLLDVKNILFYNLFENKNHTFVLLSRK